MTSIHNSQLLDPNVYLELDDPLLGQTEIHPVRVLHVESAFVQLRHWVISLKVGHLLVNLRNK